jgi:hypothetical protein
MLTGIVIDALDPALIGEFWARATQGRTAGLRLRVAAADGPKTGKNRLHLDLAGGARWAAEVDRLLGLGATRADIGQRDVPWDVLADPEGNEFCVLRPGHPGVRTDGGLAAVCLDVAAEDCGAQADFWARESGWGVAERYDWGVRLRRGAADPVSLVMGPPAAPKTGRNRLRLEVTRREGEAGELRDPAGNEFETVIEG